MKSVTSLTVYILLCFAESKIQIDQHFPSLQAWERIQLALLFTISFFIEFFPACMAACLMILAWDKRRTDLMNFAESRGTPLEYASVRKIFFMCCSVGLAVTLINVFVLPLFFRTTKENVKATIFENFLTAPNTFELPTKRNWLQYGNFWLYYRDFDAGSGWAFREPSLFIINPQGKMQSIGHCNSAAYAANNLRLNDCMQFDLNWEKPKTMKRIIINKHQMRKFFESNFSDKKIFERLPYSLYKYSYSFDQIVTRALKANCLGDYLELFDRILYLLSFLLYVFFAYLFAVKFRQRKVFIKFGYLTAYSIFLPGIYLVFKWQQHDPVLIFRLVWFWPVSIAIVLRIYDLYLKHWRYYASN